MRAPHSGQILLFRLEYKIKHTQGQSTDDIFSKHEMYLMNTPTTAITGKSNPMITTPTHTRLECFSFKLLREYITGFYLRE